MKKLQQMTLGRPVAESASAPSLIMAKGLHLLLALAEAKDGMQAKIYTVPAAQVKVMLGCNDYEVLKREFEAISDHKLLWARVRPDWEGVTHPIPSVKFRNETKTFEWDLAPSFVEAWHANLGGWRRVPLAVLLGFRSRFALKLFEWAVLQVDSGRKTWTGEFTEAELRTMLGCTDTLKGSGALQTSAIKPAIKEINQPETGIRVYYSKEGRGRQTSYSFTVELCAARQLPLPSADVSSRDPVREIEQRREEARLASKPEDQGVFATLIAQSPAFQLKSARD